MTEVGLRPHLIEFYSDPFARAAHHRHEAVPPPPKLARPIRRNFPRCSLAVNYFLFSSFPSPTLPTPPLTSLVRHSLDTFIHVNFYSARERFLARFHVSVAAAGGGKKQRAEDASRARESALSGPTNFIRNTLPSDLPLWPTRPGNRTETSNLIEFGSTLSLGSREFCSPPVLLSSFSPRRHVSPRVFQRDFPSCSVIDPRGSPSLAPRVSPSRRLPSDNTVCLPAFFRRCSRDVKRAQNRLGRSHSRGTISRERGTSSFTPSLPGAFHATLFPLFTPSLAETVAPIISLAFPRRASP